MASHKEWWLTIGDFGWGEAKLAEAVSDRHTVYSFDHIAINDNVIACDMAHVMHPCYQELEVVLKFVQQSQNN